MPFVKTPKIPRATIQRLSVYLEALNTLAHDGTKVVSSEALARFCNINAPQIRKDLAYFGEFGVRGVGYYVDDLSRSISASLGIDREWHMVLVGLGSMGRSLLRHHGMRMHGYRIVAAYDTDELNIGQTIADITVQPLAELPAADPAHSAEIGVITTRPDKAQEATDKLVAAGVCAILNFTSSRLTVPPHVFVEYVDFLHHLYALSFNLSTMRAE